MAIAFESMKVKPTKPFKSPPLPPKAVSEAAGNPNLLDLEPDRRKSWRSLYWLSLLFALAAHGGLLFYLFGAARTAPDDRPTPEIINVEITGPAEAEALPKADREDRFTVDGASGEPTDAPLAQPLPLLPRNSLIRMNREPLPEDHGARFPLAARPFSNWRHMRLPEDPASPTSSLRPRFIRLSMAAGWPEDRALTAPERAVATAVAAAGDPQIDGASDGGGAGSTWKAEVFERPGEERAAAFLPQAIAPLPARRMAHAAHIQARNWTSFGASAARGPTAAAMYASRKALSGYRKKIRTHLEAYKPDGGLGRGAVLVEFTLSRAGAVRTLRILRSSGVDVIDASVLEAVRRAEPYPAPPRRLRLAQLRFAIPFRFE